jgi:hypothetical protein
MKTVKLVVAVLLLVSSVSAVACQTQTYIIDGKIIICTVCKYVTTCN